MAAPEDLAWLAGRVELTLLAPGVRAGDVRRGVDTVRALGLRGLVLAPSHLGLVGEGVRAAAVVGFPTGRHHTLVKAAEARLAVAGGAEEVWLVPDPAEQDGNVLLAEIVAVREAVPSPVVLGVVVEAAARRDIATVRRMARVAGADRLVTATGWHPAGVTDTAVVGECAGDLPVTALGTGLTLDEAVSWLGAGADRLAVDDPAWLRAPGE